MIKITNLADYAVQLLVFAAGCSNATVTAAAKETGLPAPTLAKLVGILGHAKLVASQRGVGGGFALTRPAGQVTVLDVIEAIDGPIAITYCAGEAIESCKWYNDCQLIEPWQIINRQVRSALERVTLEDLLKRQGDFLPDKKKNLDKLEKARA